MPPIRFLVADDNTISRKLLCGLLDTREGWQVCGEAENGMEATAKAAELKPDVVILDMAMPLVDGLHAAQAIHATAPAIPILLYTMHNFAGLEIEAKKFGIRKVVSKTDAAQMLLAAIDEVLKSVEPATPAILPQVVVDPASTLANSAGELPPAPDGEGNSKVN